MKTTHPDTDSSNANSASLLQLHLAEYNAVTQRVTNRMLIAYSLFSVLLISLALIAQLITTLNPCLLVWGTAAAAQGIGFVACHLQYELYIDVLYIETALRPDVQKKIGSDHFWGYEAFIAKYRPMRPLWSEWAYVAAALIGMVAFAIWRWPLSPWDYVGLISNIFLFAALLVTTGKAVGIRRRFQRRFMEK